MHTVALYNEIRSHFDESVAREMMRPVRYDKQFQVGERLLNFQAAFVGLDKSFSIISHGTMEGEWTKLNKKAELMYAFSLQYVKAAKPTVMWDGSMKSYFPHDALYRLFGQHGILLILGLGHKAKFFLIVNLRDCHGVLTHDDLAALLWNIERANKKMYPLPPKVSNRRTYRLRRYLSESTEEEDGQDEHDGPATAAAAIGATEQQPEKLSVQSVEAIRGAAAMYAGGSA
jgi:hypothetical protein